MDRFDLEQQILQCWQVSEDIRTALAHCDTSSLHQNLQAIAQVSDLKFEKLWAIFEHMCHERHFVDTRSAAPDVASESSQR